MVLGTIEQAPDWVVDNHFLIRGYRIGFSQFKHVMKSLFMCHNETVNIWTHLLGVIMFIGIVTWIFL